MKNINLMTILICFLFSCDNQTLNKEKVFIRKITNVKDLSGNVFVFTEMDPFINRMYIIPVDEKDSNVFKKMDVIKAIQGKICIQLNAGCFSNFYRDRNKKILNYKACNLPYYSMFYSRAFVYYKNYNEVIIRPTDKNGKPIKLIQIDSCNTKVITETDSSLFCVLHIYQ